MQPHFPAGKEIALSDFFRRLFEPARLAGKRADYVAQFTSAIVWLHRALKRPPAVDDLTVANVLAVKKLIRRAGFSTSLISTVSKRLCSFSLHAFRLGLIPAACGKDVWRDDHQRRGRNDKGQFRRRRKSRRARRVRPERNSKRWQLPEPLPGSVREFYETTYRPERHINASLSTRRDFQVFFRAFYRFRGRDVLLEELTNELACEFIAWMIGNGLRAATANKNRAMLLAVWRWAVEKELLPKDPRVRKLPEIRDVPDAWTEAELSAILAAPLQIKWTHTMGGIPAGAWWRAILLVAYWSALRRGSLLELRPADVDLQSGWLNVPGSAIKNKSGKRVRLGADCIEALRSIWDPQRPRLFPLNTSLQIDSSELSDDFSAILEAAGVPPSTRLSNTQFHKIRRTVATMTAIRRGLHAACDLLGHGSTEMTKRYLDPSKLPGNDATEFLPVLS